MTDRPRSLIRDAIQIARFREAQDVIASSHSNVRFMIDDFDYRVTFPLSLGHLHVTDDGVLYTWLLTDKQLVHAPQHAWEWCNPQGALWIGDMIFKPHLSVRQAVRAMIDDMVYRGIARSGERFAFARAGRDRFGWMRV